MKAKWLLGVMVVLAMACPARAEFVYQIDNGSANQEIVGDQAGDQAYINVFSTDPSNPLITKLSVAWAGLPAGSNARMALYSVDDSAASPLPAGVAPTFLHLLQVVNTQVTAGQRNDDSGAYPPGGQYGAVWTTYDIPSTLITTQRFAVGAIAYEDNATYGSVWQDGTTVPTPHDVLIAVGSDPAHTGLALNSDLSNLINGNDMFNLRTFTPSGGSAGQWDYPYLIRATATVPEPSTMLLLGAAMAFASFLLRRRNRPAE
jgi:hypothetical protein